jgi:hypothetical protein
LPGSIRSSPLVFLDILREVHPKFLAETIAEIGQINEFSIHADLIQQKRRVSPKVYFTARAAKVSQMNAKA